MKDIYEKLSEERQQAQEDGKFPEWFTTGGYAMFKESYEYKCDGYKEQATRIAKTLAKHVPVFPTKGTEIHTKLSENYGSDWESVFFNLLWKGHLAPSTPVLANTGTRRGMPVSCSGGVVGDSIEGFYESLKENALLNKEGFGTSSYLGDIRSRGSRIAKGGKADGSHPVMLMHKRMAQEVSQAGVRRGSWAGYLEVDSEDFHEWCDNLLNEPDGKNIGWIFTKNVIEKLNQNDEEMQKRFAKILKTRCVTGKGYLWKVDHVNESQPNCYKHYGLTNKASNLCVAPETNILTRSGYIPIEELSGETIDIWNGETWSEVVVTKTGSDQKLVRVETSAGQSLDCTEYHKWYVFNGYGKPCKVKRTHELVQGDKLIKFDLPVISGGKNLEFAYDNGFFSGDGMVYKGVSSIYLYHEKQDLEKFLPSVKKWDVHPEQKRMLGKAEGLKEKFFVPSEEYSIDSRLSWLAGYLDADGCVYRNGTNEALTAVSISKEFLQDIQLMLQTLGVSSKISKMSDGGYKSLPANDGTGEKKDYFCQTTYRLLITSYDTFKLYTLGLDTKRLKVNLRRPQRDAKQFNKIISVDDHGRTDDTYCFTENKRGMGMFNGILTGQCSEITLHADLEHTYTCVLSSLNCYHYDIWKDTGAVFASTVFLDAVCSEFIEKAKGKKGLEKAVRYTEKSRSLGLGMLGFHSYLQKKGVALEEFEAHQLNKEIFEHLHDESLEASKWMAKKLGEPEWCKGFGIRGTHNTALAPNMSSAVLCGQVSQGIEPIYANVFMQDTAAGEMQRINPEFLRVAKEHGKYNKALLRDIIEHDGSVQHLDWLSDKEKLIFRTAFEIDARALLRLASTRQPYICQAQSLNLFFDADEEEAYIAEIHKEFLLDDNLLSLYYLRSQAGVKAAKDECIACT